MKKNESKQLINTNEYLKELNKNTDLISSLIHEYLLKREYFKSLDSFQEDLAQKMKQQNYYKPSFLAIPETNLIKLLTMGNKPEFFKVWNRLIPNHIRLREPQIEKVEFYVQIYFAIYPLLYKNSLANNNKTLKQSMTEFKDYIERKKYELSKSPEFLAYYALPYVPNPQTHPNYMKLFAPEWTNELKDKIIHCIKSYLPSIKYPVLYDLLNLEASKNSNKSGNAVSGDNSFINKNNNNENNLNLLNEAGESPIVNSDNITNNFSNNDAMNINFNKTQIRNDAMKAFLDALASENPFNVEEGLKERQSNSSEMSLEEIQQLKEENIRLKKKEEKNKAVYIETQKSWSNLLRNILTYSFELVMLCKSNKNRNDVVLQSDKINKKLLKYQSFLQKNLEDINKKSKSPNDVNTTNPNINISAYIDNNESIMSPNDMSHNDPLLGLNLSMQAMSERKGSGIEYDSSHLIDLKTYINVVKDLLPATIKANGTELKYAYILRELRLRIFRRSDVKLKNLSLYAIFYYDLIHSNNFMHNVLTHSEDLQFLSLELIKLLDQIASLTRGRNYLLMNKNSDRMIEDIVTCMYKEKGDTEIRRLCLSTIQKFTLRTEPQNKLISLNVIKWLIDVFIYENKTLSDFSVDYGLALIMNLSLRKIGRDKFELESEKVMQIMTNYLNSENPQILTCVNGTIYSLLKRKKFVDEAKKFKLDILLNQIKLSDAQLRKQIGYIIEEINNKDSELTNSENDVDEVIDEDPTNIEGDTNQINEDTYTELDSIDEEKVKEHYKYLGEFIIKSSDVNDEEEQKIDGFYRSNPSMINDESKKSFDETAVGGNKSSSNLDENNDNNKSMNSPKSKEEENEFNTAFQKKDRIARTPPGENK